jgi:hypothetical protein
MAPSGTRSTVGEREQRRAAERELAERAVEELRTSAGWQRWLGVRRHFHRYSLRNQILISMQRAGSHCLLGRGGVDIQSSGPRQALLGRAGERVEGGVWGVRWTVCHGVVGAIAGSGRRIVAAVPAAVGRAKSRDGRGTTAGGL